MEWDCSTESPFLCINEKIPGVSLQECLYSHHLRRMPILACWQEWHFEVVIQTICGPYIKYTVVEVTSSFTRKTHTLFILQFTCFFPKIIWVKSLNFLLILMEHSFTKGSRRALWLWLCVCQCNWICMCEQAMHLTRFSKADFIIVMKGVKEQTPKAKYV